MPGLCYRHTSDRGCFLTVSLGSHGLPCVGNGIWFVCNLAHLPRDVQRRSEGLPPCCILIGCYTVVSMMRRAPGVTAFTQAVMSLKDTCHLISLYVENIISCLSSDKLSSKQDKVYSAKLQASESLSYGSIMPT